MSVCPQLQNVPCDTITYDALDLTVLYPHAPVHSPTPPTDMGPHCTLPASDIRWPSLQTYAAIGWLLKHVRLVQVDGTHPTGMLSCMEYCFIMNGFQIITMM